MATGRIMHIASSLGLYGAEHVVLNLVRDVMPGKAEVALFDKPDGSHEAFADALRALGVPVHLLPDGVSDAVNVVTRLRRLCKTRGVGILHSHGYKPNVLASLVCLGSRRPRLICSEHGFTEKSVKSRLYGRLDRQAIRLPSVDGVACASGSVLDRCRASGVAAEKLSCIVNAVPLAATPAAPLEDRDLDLVFVGRLSIEKGADVLLDALGRVSSRRLTVAIAGDGPLLSQLTDAAKRLDHDVSFIGYCSDAQTLMQRARWLVLPSRTEGMPLSLLEAFGVGTPVVATQVGDVPLAFEAARPGLPVPRAGDAASLARTIDEAVCLGDHDWVAAQDEARRLSQGRFSYAAWIEAWRAIYFDRPSEYAA